MPRDKQPMVKRLIERIDIVVTGTADGFEQGQQVRSKT
jgi:hypothetical protein